MITTEQKLENTEAYQKGFEAGQKALLEQQKKDRIASREKAIEAGREGARRSKLRRNSV